MSKRFLPFFSVLFVALLLLQSVVSIFVYDLQLKKYKRKFKWDTLLSLPEEKLTLVKVANWLEEKPNEHFKRIHGREFHFMGEMYDIVHKKEFTDTTYYYCFHDHKENEIIHNINRWMHDNFGTPQNDSKKGKQLTEIFKQPYIPHATAFSFMLNVECISIDDAQQIYRSVASCITSPPPELV